MNSPIVRKLIGITITTVFLFAWPVSSLFTAISGSSTIADLKGSSEDTPKAQGQEQDPSNKDFDYTENSQEAVKAAKIEPVPTSTSVSTDNTSNTGNSQPVARSGFVVEIPKIGLVRGIVSNVSPVDKETYLSVIENNVAHGKGTSFPAIAGGNTYLFAHSKNVYNGTTPYGGWFTRIDELVKGDLIMIHYGGKIYRYRVTNFFVVEPTQTDVYTAISPFGTARAVTLQTCYPRGNQEKRLIVQAKEE